MINTSFFVNILLIEGIILFSLSILIVIHRIVRSVTDKTKQNRIQTLTEYYYALLANDKDKAVEKHPGGRRWKKEVLIVLMSLGDRVSGEKWEKLKKVVIEEVLLKRARLWARSVYWPHRNSAAKAFSLYATTAEHPLILRLMDDSNFLVRRMASLASVQQEVTAGVIKILDASLLEKGYPQYIYRDSLTRGSDRIFYKMLELINIPKYKKLILSLLSAKSWGKEMHFIAKDLTSTDPEIRRLALKVLQKNPLAETGQYFEKSALDPDPAIREVALLGLISYVGDQTWGMLENALNDPVWKVRLAAAKSLKKLGDKGKEILNNQNSGPSQEVAKYALVFG